MRSLRTFFLILLALTLVLAVSAPAWAAMSNIEHLGKMLYMDTSLSEPAGQSCMSCHSPMAGFADPDSDLPVSRGAISDRFGNRNSPTAAYAAYSPAFGFVGGRYVGGQFWDGRAADLVAQAQGPFLNPLEMNNPSAAAVVVKVQRSHYASMFTRVFGRNAFKDKQAAYVNIARAIAAYESSTMMNRFGSKYDAYLAGSTTLTAQEAQGLGLFTGKAGCSACHPAAGSRAVLTDFTYHNLGLPKNWDNPFLYLPLSLNPAGPDFIDLGLGPVVKSDAQNGKFKVPTLRNVAATPPYGHNGYFQTLEAVVAYYNTRDVAGAGRPAPEVAANLDTSVGDLGLTAAEVDAIVAFLHTLTDGGCGCGGMGGGGGGMGGGGGGGGGMGG